MTAFRAPAVAGARLALGLALANDLIAPRAAAAQNVTTVRPTLGVSQMYDSNLFSTPSDHEGDFVTRITSGIDSERRSPRLTLSGRYLLDGERFADHPDLTTMDARQLGTLAAEYRPSQRLSLGAGAGLWFTRTPRELSAETGLAFGRASARRTTAQASLTRHFTPVTSGTLEYALADDALTGGVATLTNTATAGVDHRLSPRGTVGMSYGFSRFAFGSGTTDVVASHVVTARWSRAISPRVRLSMACGPRVVGTSVEPEVSASLAYHVNSGDLSVAYARTETTIIGYAGTADTESVSATATWMLARSLQVRVAPGLFRNALGERQARAYALSVGLMHPLGRHVAVDAAFDGSLQRGTLTGASTNGAIGRQSVTIRLIAAPAGRLH